MALSSSSSSIPRSDNGQTHTGLRRRQWKHLWPHRVIYQCLHVIARRQPMAPEETTASQRDLFPPLIVAIKGAWHRRGLAASISHAVDSQSLSLLGKVGQGKLEEGWKGGTRCVQTMISWGSSIYVMKATCDAEWWFSFLAIWILLHPKRIQVLLNDAMVVFY